MEIIGRKINLKTFYIQPVSPTYIFNNLLETFIFHQDLLTEIHIVKMFV